MTAPRIANVWENMNGWEDPREVHPPMDCRVAVVAEDLMVSFANLKLSFDAKSLEWHLDAGLVVPFKEILAWAWIESLDEMFGEAKSCQ